MSEIELKFAIPADRSSQVVAEAGRGRECLRDLAAPEPAQAAIGSHNDAVVAIEGYRAATAGNPVAWFAVGWLTARIDDSAARARQSLNAIEGKKRFWR